MVNARAHQRVRLGDREPAQSAFSTARCSARRAVLRDPARGRRGAAAAGRGTRIRKCATAPTLARAGRTRACAARAAARRSRPPRPPPAATLAGQRAARLADAAAAGASPVSALPEPTAAAGVPPVPAAATVAGAVARRAGVAAAAEPATAQSASSEPDAALREIYARETASHVGTVRAWLGARAAHPARRTCCPKRSIAPAIRWSAARPWPKRATAYAWPNRSITGCASPSIAASAWMIRI